MARCCSQRADSRQVQDAGHELACNVAVQQPVAVLLVAAHRAAGPAIAIGLVVATGNETELGRINQLLADVSPLETRRCYARSRNLATPSLRPSG
jgi:hypothetical protein